MSLVIPIPSTDEDSAIGIALSLHGHNTFLKTYIQYVKTTDLLPYNQLFKENYLIPIESSM